MTRQDNLDLFIKRNKRQKKDPDNQELTSFYHIFQIVNSLTKQFFLKPSKKNIASLKEVIDEYALKLPERYQKMFKEEFDRAFKRYKSLKPLVWKKWGKELMKLIITLK